MSDEIVTLEDDDQVLDVELENYNVPVQEDVIHAGTTAYWDAQSSLVAEAGHIYAYTDYANIEGNDSPGIKVGDGVTFLSELPFVSGDTTVLDAHIANTVIHVTAAEKESWDSKVDPEEGKGLSENDFTDALKAKLEGIEAGAEVNVQSDWAETDTTADSFIQHKPEIPDHTSDLINDSGFITANEAPVQGVKGSAESAYRTGNVSVSKTDIGLGNVDNTSDLNKPISTAVQTALDGKQGTLTAGENITIDANNVISASGGGTGAVESVNGKTGVVVLDADDVGALPDTTTAADLGAYVKPSSGIPKTDLASAVQTSLNKADTALQTAPVTSVNGKTGAVSLSASDVDALPDTTVIPSKTSDLTNDSGFLTSAVTTFNGQSGAVTYTAPVTSVDGKTGTVTVMPSGGTVGQVLTRTASGYEWDDATGGGNVDTVNGIEPDAQKNVQVDVEITKQGWDALPSTKYTDDINYYIKDGTNIPQASVISASGVTYSNTSSGLDATTVQGAIDENASDITDLKSGLSEVMAGFEQFTGYVASIPQTFYKKNIGTGYVIFGKGVVNSTVPASSTAQKSISFSQAGLSAIYGGAVNAALASSPNSQLRYVNISNTNIDMHVYNPLPQTSGSLIYNFVLFGA